MRDVLICSPSGFGITASQLGPSETARPPSEPHATAAPALAPRRPVPDVGRLVLIAPTCPGALSSHMPATCQPHAVHRLPTHPPSGDQLPCCDGGMSGGSD